MDLAAIFAAIAADKHVLAVTTFLRGVAAAIVTQQLLKRRSLFTYYVFHQRVGMTSTDPIFGTVQATWNNTPVDNLFLCTVEIFNQSMTDFEAVEVTVYTSSTRLLNQRTELANTPHAIPYTALLQVPAGQQPTQQQFEIYNGQRRYRVATWNRGQKVILHFLNAPPTSEAPTLFVDVTHRGIKLKFAIARPQFWGVARHRAAFAGMLLGLIVISVLATQIAQPWVATGLAFIVGLAVVVSGALVISGWRTLRDWYSG
jgi:hypothetical protein